MNYKFSLITATLNREIEFELLCKSLAMQTYKNFELIVVDGNVTDIVEKTIKKYNDNIKIIYIKNLTKGLSLNRNIGLKCITGDIIAFPDDDCEYKSDTLEYVNRFFSDTSYDFFTFNYEDKVINQKAFKQYKNKISFFNFFHVGISFTIFTKRNIISDFHFDERLGAGSLFDLGEEGDMLIYLLARKQQGFYDGYYSVYHQIKKHKNYEYKQAYKHGMGCGALFKKIVIYYKQYYLFFQYLWLIIKNIGAIIITSHKKYYVNALNGKLTGFIQYKL